MSSGVTWETTRNANSQTSLPDLPDQKLYGCSLQDPAGDSGAHSQWKLPSQILLHTLLSDPQNLAFTDT